MKHGYGIIVERGKTWENIGGILRSAACFGAAFVGVIGPRYKHQVTDTMKASSKVPIFSWATFEDYRRSSPFDWIPVGIERMASEFAGSHHRLGDFVHPRSAVYFFGPEDGGLSREVLDHCKYTVEIPGGCLNQHVAASVVMWDRVRG